MFFGLNSSRSVAPTKPHNSGVSFFGMPKAGIRVTDETAFGYSAFYACQKIISETIACLPWRVFDYDQPKSPKNDHHLDDILHRKPNEEMNPFTFKELMMQHSLGWGNFSAERERNRAGQTVALWPIDPTAVDRDRDSKGNLVHVVRQGSESITLKADEVFHLRGPSRDGVNGYSVIQLARESISLGLAAEAFGASFFGNGAIPGVVIMDKNGLAKLNKEGVENLKDTWNKNNRGSARQRGVEYLDKGLELEVIGIPPGDAQFIESRRTSAIDMCRWFRVPPHKLAELDRTTHNNIESQNIEFVTDAIMPWTCRIEAETDFRLLSGTDSGRYYSKLNLMGLLRGDTAAREKWYKSMLGTGVFTIDDVLDFEDMPLIGGDAGSMRLVPANMLTVERMLSGGAVASDAGRRASDAKSASMVNLFEETAQRFCKIELSRIKKYSNKTTDNEIVSFYTEHARACANGFYRPAAVFIEQLEGKSEVIDAQLQLFFSDWCSTAADQIKNALVSNNLPNLLTAWETSRAQKLSRNLLIRLGEAAK